MLDNASVRCCRLGLREGLHRCRHRAVFSRASGTAGCAFVLAGCARSAGIEPRAAPAAALPGRHHRQRAGVSTSAPRGGPRSRRLSAPARWSSPPRRQPGPEGRARPASSRPVPQSTRRRPTTAQGRRRARPLTRQPLHREQARPAADRRQRRQYRPAQHRRQLGDRLLRQNGATRWPAIGQLNDAAAADAQAAQVLLRAGRRDLLQRRPPVRAARRRRAQLARRDPPCAPARRRRPRHGTSSCARARQPCRVRCSRSGRSTSRSCRPAMRWPRSRRCRLTRSMPSRRGCAGPCGADAAARAGSTCSAGARPTSEPRGSGSRRRRRTMAYARTLLYPNVNLVAFVGLSSLGVNRWLNSGSEQYGAGAWRSAFAEIFDAGRPRVPTSRARSPIPNTAVDSCQRDADRRQCATPLPTRSPVAVDGAPAARRPRRRSPRERLRPGARRYRAGLATYSRCSPPRTT